MREIILARSGHVPINFNLYDYPISTTRYNLQIIDNQRIFTGSARRAPGRTLSSIFTPVVENFVCRSKILAVRKFSKA